MLGGRQYIVCPIGSEGTEASSSIAYRLPENAWTRLIKDTWMTRKISTAVISAVLATSIAVPVLAQNAKSVDWTYHGSELSNRYSPLNQITPANVTQLKEAWRFPMDQGGLETQPIMVGRTVYVVTTSRKAVALDAVTGQVKWTFDPGVTGNQPIRGLTPWMDGNKLRILFGRESVLYQLDAETGKLVPSFGQEGHIDVRENLRGAKDDNAIYLTSPAAVYQNLIIVNGRLAENTPASPGDVRAFDGHTGKLVWTFHTIPHPGEVGADTWPKDAYLTQGGANAWSGASVDTARGIVFVNTGSPADDFYGAKRLGDNRMANSTIALDAKTGKRIWDFQQVHHDLWDSDSTVPPMLTTIKKDGKNEDIVVAVNKAAYIYVLDRLTGKPVFPIVETPVPPSNVPGEVASKTQPIPSLPHAFSRKVITVNELNDSSPEENKLAREAFAKLYGNGQPYVPLGLNQDTLVIPGFAYGFGGIAADHNGIMYASASNGAGLSKIVDNTEARQHIGEPGAPLPAGGMQNGYAHLDYSFSGYGQFRLPDGKPGLSAAASQGTLNAIDLNTGQYRWTIPLAARSGGSGPLVTASGLLFIASGNKLQAYASADGKLIWEQPLPGAGGNSPGTYMVDGKQYVVIASGGGSAPCYVAYSLN